MQKAYITVGLNKSSIPQALRLCNYLVILISFPVLYSVLMTIMLTLFAGAVVLELVTYAVRSLPRIRKAAAALSVVGIGLAAGGLFVTRSNVFTGLIALLSLYRMFNMVRIVQERMHERYLRHAIVRTGFSLVVMQAIFFACWAAWQTWHTTGVTTWLIVTAAEAAIATVFLMSVIRTLRRTAWPATGTAYSDKELPTVTVAIPARNETEDLQHCLESVLANDYPKLEVLVLDDCSQTKRTPQIIKAFAHDGVRFIQGEIPSDTWLPKNQAYDRLVSQASGEYILFCGVDMLFRPDSIRQAITVMLDRQKQMLCIFPARPKEMYGRLSLIQAMRYWWELVPPRRSFNRPPVLSSCWIINRNALRKAGGFKAVARAIVPEAHFARVLTASDGYSFVRSGKSGGFTSTKPIQEQRNTAIRMRYPQLHKRPEQVALFTLLEGLFLILPAVLTIGGFWMPIGPAAHILAAVTLVLLVACYLCLVLSTHVNTWWFGLIGQPFAAMSDVILLHYSMWKYEFSTVEWKGRNVCIPVMHVVSHLPE